MKIMEVVGTKLGERGKGMRNPQWKPWQVVLGVLLSFAAWNGLVAASVVSAQSEGDLAKGKKLYIERCAHCHGDGGDGVGSATDYVFPKPRDFTSGVYKFRSRHETEDGNTISSDSDIYRSICEGLHGSSMPGWCGFFTDKQVWQLVHYIKTFAEVFTEDKPGEPIDYGGEISSSPESIAKGKEAFEKDFECYTCHGMAGRGNGPRAIEGLEDDWGHRAWPANLTQPWTYRGGMSRKDIFRNVVMGIGGTPMPPFADPDPLAEAKTIEDEDERKEEEASARELRDKLWHVVNYVESLWTVAEEPQVKSVLLAKKIEGALPLSPDDVAWDEVPQNYYPIVGQVVEGKRLFTPTIIGMGMKALHNGKEVAFRLTWDDRTESESGESNSGKAYVDAAALQFPSTPLEGSEKPYFLMGDSSKPVDLWYWRNDTKKTVKLQTKGYKTFNSNAPRDDGNSGRVVGLGVVDDGQYRVVMSRALQTKDSENEMQFAVGTFVQFSLTTWDGSNGETGGDQRGVSAWYNLYLEPEASKAPLYLMAIGIVFGLVIEFSALYVIKQNGADDHASSASGAAASQAQNDTASETGGV